MVRAEAGIRRNAKAVQQALLASLQACRQPLHQVLLLACILAILAMHTIIQYAGSTLKVST